MEKVAKQLTELIGNTPMLELTNYEAKYQVKARLIAKLEYFNPLGSAKDRVAFEMIEQAMAEGKIDQDTVIIEPTSGNTGIGLAFVTAVKGLHLILTMPDTMSMERRRIVSALGAEVVLSKGSEGMQGAIDKANELAEKYGNSFIPQQFENPANAEAHRKTTGEEILRDLDGKVDVFVAGIGTGGTITGTAQTLKKYNPDVKIVGFEPDTSAVISGESAGRHGLQGIGAGFIPKVLKLDLVDEVMRITDAEAYETAREIAKTDGVFVGITSGAAVCAARKLAERVEYQNKNIVVLLPDTGERYLSTSLFEES